LQTWCRLRSLITAPVVGGQPRGISVAHLARYRCGNLCKCWPFDPTHCDSARGLEESVSGRWTAPCMCPLRRSQRQHTLLQRGTRVHVLDVEDGGKFSLLDHRRQDTGYLSAGSGVSGHPDKCLPIDLCRGRVWNVSAGMKIVVSM